MRAQERRRFEIDLNDELAATADEADPYFDDRWPWSEPAHTLGRALRDEYEAGEMDEVAKCLRWGLPLDEASP